MKTKQRTRWDLTGEHAELVVRAQELRLSPIRKGRLLPIEELRDLVNSKQRRKP